MSSDEKTEKHSESHIEERVIAIVVEQCDLDPSTTTRDSSYTEDLGLDSLDLVELVMSLEDEFGYSIPDEEVEKIKTINDTILYILKEQN